MLNCPLLSSVANYRWPLMGKDTNVSIGGLIWPLQIRQTMLLSFEKGTILTP